ncbi:hypothetical protein INR49_020862 [Caranx melampygus]|nr:hypothetical protein INR49_020862 [Caranx melampygus]
MRAHGSGLSGSPPETWARLQLLSEELARFEGECDPARLRSVLHRLIRHLRPLFLFKATQARCLISLGSHNLCCPGNHV